MMARAHLFRLVVSLVADELGVQRGRPVDVATQATWSEETRLDDEASPAGALAFDSLARIDVSARLNNAFHLHETGVEDYLLTQKTLGGLLDVIEAAFRLRCENLTFLTSGSTGQPKPCIHTVASLRQEVEHLATLVAGTGRIVALVPPHHIYGFLFTVLLPDRLGIEVADARIWGPGRLARELGTGDLLVATPHLWSYVARSLPRLPEGVAGISSTAPMPDELKAALLAQGLVDLVEIYGSSETAGIGARRSGETAFTLFPHWRPQDGVLVRTLPDGMDAPAIAPMDRLEWDGERRFRPAGRHDGAVQVGGVNVFPERVAAILSQHDAVAECAVRPVLLDGDQARTRLKAFIVPAEPAAVQNGLIAALEAHAARHLAPLERPTQWTVGTALPRNAMGKLADW